MAFNQKYNKSLDSGSSIRRQLFGLQPARVLLLDANVLFGEGLGQTTIEALEKIFLLSSNLNGTCPVPLIGIYLLTAYPELILPLNHTKSNFVRLHSALTDLQNIVQDSGKMQHSKQAECCLNDGVAEACRQFRRYTGNLPGNAANFHQLEIIFLTTRPANEVKKHFVALPDQADINIIRRIVCATISSVFNENTPADSPDTGMDLMSDDLMGLVDTVILEGDPISLQKFLYSWLSDSTFDKEQLQLILPSPSPVEEQLVIKCDMAERMISPLQLPIHDAFSLDIKSNVCKHVFPPPSKASGLHVPIFQLEVVHSIPRQSVCDSLLFGQPIVLQPTGCWKMEWDCLEKNQQMFNALCTELAKKDHVLLTRSMTSSQGSQGDLKCGRYANSNNLLSANNSTGGSNAKPNGYFILMPSEKSMLMKSVTCGELYLPSSRSLPSAPVSEENQLCIQSSLSKVEDLNHFNPLEFQCGLFGALRLMSLPKTYLNKARQQQQQRTQFVPKKAERGVIVATPGGRVTASGWSGNITDVTGTQAYQTKNKNKYGKF